MNGEDHLSLGVRAQRRVHVDHRTLHDVGCRTLNRQVHRHPFGSASNLPVAAVQFRHQAPPSVHRPDDSRGAPFCERPIDERAHAGEPGKVGIDEVLRDLLGHADVLREAEGGLAIEQRVVHHFRLAPGLVAIARAVRSEDLQGRLLVKVGPAPERFDQEFVTGHMREDAELDLRIVRRDQHVAGFRDEGAPDLASELGPDGDVLQVRITAAQPAGCRHRLVEAGVNAAGVGIHELGQGVDVGAFQLHQRTPFENHAGEVVRERELFEHLHSG